MPGLFLKEGREKRMKRLTAVLAALLLCACPACAVPEGAGTAGYTLPVDFSPGMPPDPANYVSETVYEDPTIRVEITPDKPIVVQKRSFLAAAAGVQVSTHFNKGVGKGLFGGEGFIMQRLDGNGIAFVEVDGSTVEYELQAGQQLVIDTGHLAMMDATVSIDVQRVKGAKNMLFGGEGLFNTVVTGPGRVLLQTMPLVNFVGQISSMLPSK